MALVGLGTLVTLIGFVLLGPVVARPAAAVIGAPIAVLRGRAGRLARRNAMRNPRRTAATASALMIGVAVVAAFTVLGASVKASLAHTADTAVRADLVIAQGNSSTAPGLDPAMVPALQQLPELDAVVGAGIATMRLDGDTVQPMVMDTARIDAVTDMQVRRGSLATLPDDGLAVQSDYARDHGWTIGTTVPVTFPDGTHLDADRRRPLRAEEPVRRPHRHHRRLRPARHPADRRRHLDDPRAPASPATRRRPRPSRCRRTFYAPDVQTRSEYLDSVNAQIDQLLAFVYGLLAVAVIIAVIGIGNTISLSVYERTRELGLLRAVGQSRRRVRTMVRGEAVVVAIFGTVGGLLLGTAGGWAVVRAIGADQGIVRFALPLDRIAVVVALGALAGILAAHRPARRAAKLDVLAAIATS